jgi:hypothetical protein
MQKYTACVDYVGSHFWRYLLTLLEKLRLKLQKFLIYSHNSRIIHILVYWNPLENGAKTTIFLVILITVNSVSP